MIKTFTPSKHHLKQTLLAWLLCILVMFSSMLAMTLTAHAANAINIESAIGLAYAIQKNGKDKLMAATAVLQPNDDWDDPLAGKNADKNAPDPITNAKLPGLLSYSNLQILTNNLEKNFIRSDKTPKLYNYAVIARSIYRGFASQSDYQTALTKLCKCEWTTTATERTPVATGNATANQVTSAISGFTGAVAQGTVTDAFSGTFDMSNWDPNVGVAGAAMSTVGNIVNQIFFIVSNLMMLFFMVQTGFDVLYLVVEPVRPFLTKGGGNGAGLNGNGAGGSNILSKFRLPICSSSAVEAAGGGGGNGGLGGNQAGTGKGSMVIKYLASRAPVLILGAIYLILVTMGYWQQLIGWIAGFVIQALDWLMTLGK